MHLGQVTKKAHPRDQAIKHIPSITLPSTSGRDIALEVECAKQHLVIFCYPGDREGLRYPALMGCTPEACNFRDHLCAFHDLDTKVFGLSMQSTSRQQEFVVREHLNFEILSDSNKKLIHALGICTWLSDSGEEFVSRQTVLVKKGGEILEIYADITIETHVNDILQRLQSLPR